MLRPILLGSGMYVPPRIVTNEELAPLLEVTPQWILEKSGVEKRHHVEGEQTTADLGYQAALEAIAEAGIPKEQIDILIFATLSPEYAFPGSAFLLQQKLGVPKIPAIDLRAACSGMVYALALTEAFIRSGLYKCVLVVGGEVHSTSLDFSPQGREVSMLFGDGAGALLFGAAEVGEQKKGLLSTHIYADGNFAKDLWMEGPGSALPGYKIDSQVIAEGRVFPQMSGKNVILQASRKIPEAIQAAMEHNKITKDEIDFLVLHQANLNLIAAVGKRLGLRDEQVLHNLERYGNTSAASIPICLHEHKKLGLIQPGARLMLAGFGSGLSWGSAYLVV